MRSVGVGTTGVGRQLVRMLVDRGDEGGATAPVSPTHRAALRTITTIVALATSAVLAGCGTSTSTSTTPTPGATAGGVAASTGPTPGATAGGVGPATLGMDHRQRGGPGDPQPG